MIVPSAVSTDANPEVAAGFGIKFPMLRGARFVAGPVIIDQISEKGWIKGLLAHPRIISSHSSYSITGDTP
jgi:hypothetical protein